jgi:hypothetical protein
MPRLRAWARPVALARDSGFQTELRLGHVRRDGDADIDETTHQSE